MMKKTTGLTIILFVLFTLGLNAQCKINNSFFQAGEELTYDLYYKYGLINAKAGTSSLKTVAERHNNTDALKMTLLAHSTGAIRKVFSLSDTLICYTTKDLVPLAHIKNAKEGKDYTKENFEYSYNGKGVSIKAKRIRNGELKFDEIIKSESCIFDMMSIVYYARTLNYGSMKQGETTKVDFLSGREKSSMIIEYLGNEVIEANDDKKYNCIKLVLSIADKAFTNKKEAMRVYITNDNNRMPVRLDSKLNIGSTRAMLKSYKGNKHPVKTN